MRSSMLALALSIVSALCLPATEAAAASFEALGDLDGGKVISRAYAVSADGSTVVGIGRTDVGDEDSSGRDRVA